LSASNLSLRSQMDTEPVLTDADLAAGAASLEGSNPASSAVLPPVPDMPKSPVHPPPKSGKLRRREAREAAAAAAAATRAAGANEEDDSGSSSSSSSSSRTGSDDDDDNNKNNSQKKDQTTRAPKPGTRTVHSDASNALSVSIADQRALEVKRKAELDANEARRLATVTRKEKAAAAAAAAAAVAAAVAATAAACASGATDPSAAASTGAGTPKSKTNGLDRPLVDYHGTVASPPHQPDRKRGMSMPPRGPPHAKTNSWYLPSEEWAAMSSQEKKDFAIKRSRSTGSARREREPEHRPERGRSRDPAREIDQRPERGRSRAPEQRPERGRSRAPEQRPERGRSRAPERGTSAERDQSSQPRSGDKRARTDDEEDDRNVRPRGGGGGGGDDEGDYRGGGGGGGGGGQPSSTRPTSTKSNKTALAPADLDLVDSTLKYSYKVPGVILQSRATRADPSALALKIAEGQLEFCDGSLRGKDNMDLSQAPAVHLDGCLNRFRDGGFDPDNMCLSARVLGGSTAILANHAIMRAKALEATVKKLREDLADKQKQIQQLVKDSDADFKHIKSLGAFCSSVASRLGLQLPDDLPGVPKPTTRNTSVAGARATSGDGGGGAGGGSPPTTASAN
jgi:hypothetical protein